MVKKSISALLLLSLFLTLFSGCSSAPERYSRSYYEYFDTVSTVIGYAESQAEFDAACDAAIEVLEKYHRISDIYHEYSGINNLKTVNDNAGIAPVTVPRELIDLVEFSMEMNTLSGGKVNVAFGAVLSIWHEYRTENAAAVPSYEMLQIAATHCDSSDVVIDRESSSIYLADPGMSLDLGAIAKGYATQRAGEALRELGYSAYILDIGGNIRAVGPKPDGEAWTAGVQDPNADSGSAYVRKLNITDAALATSGSYQRYYEVNGTRYHHIIDPATLFPENRYLSVTVLCLDAGLADALSTALFNMEINEGQRMVAELEGVEALWNFPDGSISCSEGFEASIVP